MNPQEMTGPELMRAAVAGHLPLSSMAETIDGKLLATATANPSFGEWDSTNLSS